MSEHPVGAGSAVSGRPPDERLTVAAALEYALELETVSDSARLDLELLLCEVLQQPRSWLFAWPEATLSAQQRSAFLALLARRRAGEPVAHLLGYRDFWTLRLRVTPATLIPRPDTEVLVEQALRRLDGAPARVADLGTGTGAVALALASERPNWQLVATELQPEAVELARLNVAEQKLTNVTVYQGDWCQPLRGAFDLIVSNPPYIDPEDPHLKRGDLRFEPLSALIAARNGMAALEQIAAQARRHLRPGGWLLLEHGYDQAEAVRRLLQRLGYLQPFSARDYGGHERVSGGVWPGRPHRLRGEDAE
jgi:release factor glutamine methyltransferase